MSLSDMLAADVGRLLAGKPFVERRERQLVTMAWAMGANAASCCISGPTFTDLYMARNAVMSEANRLLVEAAK